MAEKKKKKKKKLLIAGVVTPVMLAIFGIATVVLLPKILWDKAWGAVMDAIEAIIDTGKGVAQWLGDPNQPDREQLALMRFKDADGFDDLYSFDFLFALDQDDDSENPYAGLKNKISAAFSKMYLSESDMVTLLDALYDPATTKADADYVSTHFLYKPQITLKLSKEEYAQIYENAFEVLAHSEPTARLIREYREYRAGKRSAEETHTVVNIRDADNNGLFTNEDTYTYYCEDMETCRKKVRCSTHAFAPEYVDSEGHPINQQHERTISLVSLCDLMYDLRDEKGNVDIGSLQVIASWWRHYGGDFHYSPIASYINTNLKEKTKNEEGDKAEPLQLGEEDYYERMARFASVSLEPTGEYKDATITFINESNRLYYYANNDNFIPESYTILFQDDIGVYTIDAFLWKNGKIKTFSTVSYEDETRKFGVDWQMMYAALVLYGRGNEPTGTDKEELEKQIKAIQEQQEGGAEVDKDSGTLKIKKSVIKAMAKTFKDMEELERNDVTSIEAINDYLKEKNLYYYADINSFSSSRKYVKWNDAADLTHEIRSDELFKGVTSKAYVPTYIPRTYKSALCDVTYASYEGSAIISKYTITYHWDTFANELKKKGIDLNDEKIWEEYKKVLEELPGGERIIAKLEHVKKFSGTEFQEDMAYSVQFGNYERVGGVYATIEFGDGEGLPYPRENGGRTVNADSEHKSNPTAFRSRVLTEEEKEAILKGIDEMYPGYLPEQSVGRTMIKTALDAVGRITYNQTHRNGSSGDFIKPFSNDNLRYFDPVNREGSDAIFRDPQWRKETGLSDSGFYADPYTYEPILPYGLFGSIYMDEAWPLSVLFPQAKACSYSKYSYDENGEWVLKTQSYPYTADCSSFTSILYTAALVSFTGEDVPNQYNMTEKNNLYAFRVKDKNGNWNFWSTGTFRRQNNAVTLGENKELNNGKTVNYYYQSYAIPLKAECADWTKSDLRPGDLLVREGHVLLFLGWCMYESIEWRPLCIDMTGAGNSTDKYAYGACSLSVLGEIEKNTWYRGYLNAIYTDLSNNPFNPLTMPVTELPGQDYLIDEIETGQ